MANRSRASFHAQPVRDPLRRAPFEPGQVSDFGGPRRQVPRQPLQDPFDEFALREGFIGTAGGGGHRGHGTRQQHAPPPFIAEGGDGLASAGCLEVRGAEFEDLCERSPFQEPTHDPLGHIFGLGGIIDEDPCRAALRQECQRSEGLACLELRHGAPLPSATESCNRESTHPGLPGAPH